MTFAVLQHRALDSAGNLRANVDIRVRRETAGLPLVALYADKDGGSTLSNPTVGGFFSDGRIRAYLAAGFYRVELLVDAEVVDTFYDVGVGLSQGSDEGADGVSAGFAFTYNTATSGNPGIGAFLLNNSTFGSVTAINISETDANGNSLASLLARWDDGTSIIRGEIIITKPNGAYMSLDVTGTLTDNGAYDTFTVTPVSSGGTFTNGDEVAIFFIPKGDRGTTLGNRFTFNTATSGDPGSGRLLFNNASFASVTAMNISETDADGIGIATLLAAIDNSNSSNKCLAIIRKEDAAAFKAFWITSTLTDNGSYDTFTINPVTEAGGAFSNNDILHIAFYPVGDRGTAAQGFTQAFDNSTTDADPGNGEFRLNHATPTSATAIYLDNLAAFGATVSGIIDTWDDSTNTIRGTLRIEKLADPSVWYQWNVTGSVVDGTGYRKVTIASGAGAGTLTAGDQFAIMFSRAGNVGADGRDPGLLLTWDTSTSDADPGGPGGIRANNASLASATLLYIDKSNRAGNDISTFLAALDDSSGTPKGTLILTRVSDDTQATFNVGLVTDASGYIKLAVSGHSGATSFSNGDAISFQFSRAGDGVDGTAWTAFTPTVTSNTGTITTLGAVSGRYKLSGKTVFWQLSIAITTNGTGGGFIRAAGLPFTTAAFRYMGAGQEISLTGDMLVGNIPPSTSECLITFYDGTYPGADGRTLVLTGVAEIA